MQLMHFKPQAAPYGAAHAKAITTSQDTVDKSWKDHHTPSIGTWEYTHTNWDGPVISKKKAVIIYGF